MLFGNPKISPVSLPSSVAPFHPIDTPEPMAALQTALRWACGALDPRCCRCLVQPKHLTSLRLSSFIN